MSVVISDPAKSIERCYVRRAEALAAADQAESEGHEALARSFRRPEAVAATAGESLDPSEAPWADLLEALPTIGGPGQDSDLKVDQDSIRVWLARGDVADGEPFARTVYVEEYDGDRWNDVGYFDGDEASPAPWPEPMERGHLYTLDAWRFRHDDSDG